MESCAFLSGWHCSPGSTGCARLLVPSSLLHWGIFLFFFFGQRKGPLFCLVSGIWAWQLQRSAERLGTAAARQLWQGLNRTEPNRAGLGKVARARSCRWAGPSETAMWLPALLPARLCAGDGNGDMKHVCAASRSPAEFPTVIILLPSLPAGCQRGGLITAPLLFK